MGVKSHFILHTSGADYLDVVAYRQLQAWESRVNTLRVKPIPPAPWRKRIIPLYKWLQAQDIECGKLAMLKTRNLWKDPVIRGSFRRLRGRKK